MEESLRYNGPLQGVTDALDAANQSVGAVFNSALDSVEDFTEGVTSGIQDATRSVTSSVLDAERAVASGVQGVMDTISEEVGVSQRIISRNVDSLIPPEVQAQLDVVRL